MPIDAAKALAAEPRSGEISWTAKDVLLYHLGIGAGLPATDPDELRYTLESRLHVLPSFATVAGGGPPGVIDALSMPGVDVDLARVLHGGQSLISPRIATLLLGRVRETAGAEVDLSNVHLSARELEVLGLLAAGRANHEIAETLVISPSTVHNHISSILIKLQVENRVQAAVRAVREGLV